MSFIETPNMNGIQSNPILNKLAFNGFHVTVWDHETREIRVDAFPTMESVRKRGFQDAEFPDAEDFAEGLYNVFGDRVGQIKDNDGRTIYDDWEAMVAYSELRY